MTALTGSLLLAGCGTVPLGQHQPAAAQVVKLRDAAIAPLKVGEFRLAAGKSAALDKSVSVRGLPLQPPKDNATFSGYLRESLVADLQASGRYDPSSGIVVSGELTDNQLHAAGVSHASATLAARFVVTRDGKPAFDKVVSSESGWESSFLGVIAVQEALNHYTELYGQLLAKLYDDPEFIRAAARAP